MSKLQKELPLLIVVAAADEERGVKSASIRRIGRRRVLLLAPSAHRLRVIYRFRRFLHGAAVAILAVAHPFRLSGIPILIPTLRTISTELLDILNLYVFK